jgi:hypothetical protein
MKRMSRTRPSVTQPVAPRATEAVESSSPRRDAPAGAAAEHRYLAGLQVVDQGDLQLVRVLAVLHFIDVVIEAGARVTQQHDFVVERADVRRHRLVHEAEAVEHVGYDRDIKRSADLSQEIVGS